MMLVSQELLAGYFQIIILLSKDFSEIRDRKKVIPALDVEEYPLCRYKTENVFSYEII